jgi:predicted transcriptional regulator
VFDSGVVAGSLDDATLRSDDEELVEAVMKEGPPTVRLTEEVPALADRMGGKGLDHMIVTRPDGRLVGVYRRPLD